MTIDEFFGDNIVENLATFLKVPKEKIRVMSVVRETSSRRRRNTDSTVINFEIGQCNDFDDFDDFNHRG